MPDAAKDPAGFVEGVLDAAERVGFRVLLCGLDRDLIALARERDRLGTLAASVPELDALLRITAKRTLNELAPRAGLRVPPTIEVDRARLQQLELSMPFVIKPLRSEDPRLDGRFVRTETCRVESHDELRRVAEALQVERCLAQACVSGRLGAICGVAWKGQIVVAVHQLAERIWPVGGGISAYARTVPADPVLQDRVARLLRDLDWSGIFQAQFIFSENGPYLIDINPRIYGSIPLATAAGANLPAIWVALLLGEPIPEARYRVGARYRSEEIDARALLHFFRTGRRAEAWRGLLPHRGTVHSVVSLSDPLPVLTTAGRIYRRLARALVPKLATRGTSGPPSP